MSAALGAALAQGRIPALSPAVTLRRATGRAAYGRAAYGRAAYWLTGRAAYSPERSGERPGWVGWAASPRSPLLRFPRRLCLPRWLSGGPRVLDLKVGYAGADGEVLEPARREELRRLQQRGGARQGPSMGGPVRKIHGQRSRPIWEQERIRGQPGCSAPASPATATLRSRTNTAPGTRIP